MRIGSWAAAAGVSALLGACSGVTTNLGTAVGGAGGSISPGIGGGGSGSIGGQGVGGSAPAIGGAFVAGGSDPGVGGAVASGGSAGIGGALPPLAPMGPQQKSSKLDVLFVIDNSSGMANKQAILAASVPGFITRLVNPPCVDAQGSPVATQPASGAAACSSGTRQFTPVTDMHLGAITTSLGSHGGMVCSAPGPNDDPSLTHLDDQAELVATKRTGVASYMSSGFASFDFTGKAGDSDPTVATTELQTMITAAGEHGCGYEATLESMYRFLIDPEPPVSVSQVDGVSVPMGINQDLLAQREAFLRPGSSVAIVILSDENDCSILDSGVGWFIGSDNRMPKATVACATNPNDPCCRSCAQNEPSGPPSGCMALSADANCAGAPADSYNTWDSAHDSLNLRCFDQKARFGFDLLNPVERYEVGLTNPQVYDREGALVDNPLLTAREGNGPRSASLVSVSVIVGAPWQDLASADSLTSANLTYLNAAGLDSNLRWPMLIGDAADNVAPSDPLMVESIGPRSGTSPVTGAMIAPDTSMNPLQNPSNGHEQNVPSLDDLQYACTFALATPEVCANGDSTCECSATKNGDATAVTAANSPLCQPPGGGAASTTQYYAEGYPGIRQLVFAQALGNRAAPASICPKVTSPASSASYGYLPALNALVDRIAVTLE
jgi:hypothetical protein